MKPRTFIHSIGIFTLLVLAGGGAAAALHSEAPNADPVSAGIQSSIAQLRAALRKGDVEGILQTYTPDSQLVMPGQVLMGRDAIRPTFEFLLGMGIRDIRCENQEFFNGAGTTVETGRTVLLDAAGIQLASNRYMTLWKKEGGQWRIHRDVVAPEAATTQAAQKPAATFHVKHSEAFSALVVPMKGSFRQHTEGLLRLGGELDRLKAQPVGPAFGRYFNSPDKVQEAELRWEIGIPVQGVAEVQAPLELRQFPAEDVICSVVYGPREEVPRPWGELGAWMQQQGYVPAGPAMEKWVNQTTTEMQLPVRKVK